MIHDQERPERPSWPRPFLCQARIEQKLTMVYQGVVGDFHSPLGPWNGGVSYSGDGIIHIVPVAVYKNSTHTEIYRYTCVYKN